MIEAPDLEASVFCRVVRDVRLGEDEEVGRDGDEDGIRWRRGDVHVLRYALIREAVLEGTIELI